MGSARDANKVLGIKEARPTLENIIHGDRIDVMNVDSADNIESFEPHVASIVPNYDLTTGSTPFRRRVEVLIEETAVAEGIFSDFSVELEVIEALFEGLELRKLGI